MQVKRSERIENTTHKKKKKKFSSSDATNGIFYYNSEDFTKIHAYVISMEKYLVFTSFFFVAFISETLC